MSPYHLPLDLLPQIKGSSDLDYKDRIPTHCGVAYESIRSLARSHVMRVCSLV